MNKMMSRSHQLVAKAKRDGRIKYPKDNICMTCGNIKPLVAHHWNGNENTFDLWFVCRSCNKVLPNGGLTLDEARNQQGYAHREARRLKDYISFRSYARSDTFMSGMWKEMADEIYPYLTEAQKSALKMSHDGMDVGSVPLAESEEA